MVHYARGSNRFRFEAAALHARACRNSISRIKRPHCRRAKGFQSAIQDLRGRGVWRFSQRSPACAGARRGHRTCEAQVRCRRKNISYRVKSALGLPETIARQKYSAQCSALPGMDEQAVTSKLVAVLNSRFSPRGRKPALSPGGAGFMDPKSPLAAWPLAPRKARLLQKNGMLRYPTVRNSLRQNDQKTEDYETRRCTKNHQTAHPA